MADMKVHGTFVQKDSYHGLVDRETGASINDMISSAFKKGSVVDVTITLDYINKVPLCQERNRYSRCDEVLNDDGSCPEATNHVEAEVTAN